MTDTASRTYDAVHVVPASDDYVRPDTGHREAGASRGRFFLIDDDARGVHFRAAHDLSAPGRSTPRHRHTFEQVHLHLAGKEIFEGESRPPWTFAYHPESVYYGPQQTPPDGAEVCVVQFPAPSGKFFGSVETVRDGIEGLKRDHGVEVRDGIVHWPDGREQDSVEAVWEYLAGGTLDYAPARFPRPVVVFADAFPWTATEHPGVSVRHLGYFNECGPNAMLVRYAPGASTPGGRLGCAQVRFVVEGQVDYRGQACGRVSFLYYPPGVPYEPTSSVAGATVWVVQLALAGAEPPPREVV